MNAMLLSSVALTGACLALVGVWAVQNVREHGDGPTEYVDPENEQTEIVYEHDGYGVAIRDSDDGQEIVNYDGDRKVYGRFWLYEDDQAAQVADSLAERAGGDR